MKNSFCCICLLLIYTNLFAEADSVARPKFKIFANGSIAIVNGWGPEEGRFYSEDWYEGGEKPVSHSVGFHFGALLSVRIASSNYYIATGVEMSSYTLSNFRTQPAPDPRQLQPHGIVFDTSYSDYVIRSLHIPVYFQIPLLSRSTYIGMRAGVINDYSYSSEYNIVFSDSTGNHTKSINDGKDAGMHFTSTRLLFGVDFEFHVANSRIAPLLSLNLATIPIFSGSNEYFLHYSSVLSFSFGFGYCF